MSNGDHTPITGIPLGPPPSPLPGNTDRQSAVSAVSQPWLTNGLVGVVLLMLGTGGVVGKDAYDDLKRANQLLQEDLRDVQNKLSDLAARNQVQTKTIEQLESEAASRRALEVRLGGIELRVNDNSRRLDHLDDRAEARNNRDSRDGRDRRNR
jgi:cell division protein FtsB